MEWRLFIDSSSKSLKAVLLNIGNKIASVPVAHSVQFTENYENMKLLLSALKYSHHNWKICGDLKAKGQCHFVCFHSVIRSFIFQLSPLPHINDIHINSFQLVSLILGMQGVTLNTHVFSVCGIVEQMTNTTRRVNDHLEKYSNLAHTMSC